MFWKKSEQPPRNTLPLNNAFSFNATQKAKESPVDNAEQLRMKAKVFVEESRSRVMTEGKKITDFTDGYWFYGYFLGSMSITMIGAMALGGRVPFVSRYAAWISLAGGYGGASGCMFFHKVHLLRQFRKSVDKEIEMAKKLDDESGNSLGEYQLEIKRLETVLKSLTAGRNEVQHVEEESAEDLAARYAKQMKWDFKHMEKA